MSEILDIGVINGTLNISDDDGREHCICIRREREFTYVLFDDAWILAHAAGLKRADCYQLNGRSIVILTSNDSKGRPDLLDYPALARLNRRWKARQVHESKQPASRVPIPVSEPAPETYESKKAAFFNSMVVDQKKAPFAALGGNVVDDELQERLSGRKPGSPIC